MGTQGVPKKKSSFLHDVVKLCRSIGKLLPRDKPSLSSCSSFDFDPKTKLKTKSKRSDHHHHHHLNVRDVRVPLSQNLQEAKADAKEEGVRLYRVHSYRFDGADVRNKKPSLSRSCSQNTARPMRRTLSSFARSKSSCNRTDATFGFTRSLTRTATSVQRTFTNPILYSSSTATVAKPPPTEEELICTLEELCNGCTKKIKIKRDVISNSGETSQEEEMVEIKLKPGWRGGTKVTFEGKGNEAMGSVPADLTFVIVEKEHKLFTREGDDLEMQVEIPLLEALTGCEISVALQTINGWSSEPF